MTDADLTRMQQRHTIKSDKQTVHKVSAAWPL